MTKQKDRTKKPRKTSRKKRAVGKAAPGGKKPKCNVWIICCKCGKHTALMDSESDNGAWVCSECLEKRRRDIERIKKGEGE